LTTLNAGNTIAAYSNDYTQLRSNPCQVIEHGKHLQNPAARFLLIDMKIPRPILMAGLLLAVATAGWLVVSASQLAIHPRVLPRFAKADRVVLSWGSVSPVITITGPKAREIVHLVTTARRVNQPIGILFVNEVRFYQGTNYLGWIYTSGGLFSAGGSDGYGFEAEKEKMESLVDNPVQRAREAEHLDKTPAAAPKPSSDLVPAGRAP